MVKKSLEAKVRPLANPSLEKASLLGAGRIYVSKDSFISLTGNLENARHCIVERIDDQPIRREASLWVLPGGGNLSPNVVMMTRAFQDAAGFKVGDQIRVSLSGDAMPDAEVVTVQEVGEVDAEMKAPTKHLPCWEHSISLSLDRADLIFPGMVFEGVSINKLRRSFKVITVNSKSSNVASFKLASTTVQILQENEEKPPTEDVISGGELVLTGVHGLTKQVKTINQFLKAFTRPFWIKGERETCALVLHGSSGTGKTFILQRLAATGWGRPFWIQPSDKLSSIRETFKQAREQQPSMIFIEKLGDILDKERSNRSAVIDSIADELDALSALALANDALPRVVVIATCLDYMSDIPPVLQKCSRLGDSVALPIPRAEERMEILESIDPPVSADKKKDWLWDLAQKTHAFTGGDLARLVLNAKKILGSRLDEEDIDPTASDEQRLLTRDDLDNALCTTRPTAMHDINLKPPTIHWQDVGGQENLKKVLARMIRNAKDNNPAIRRVLPHPPKGLLLYGPPGCSKTLSAQAMATESSFNFFAVKGAELLNMYVGESERAVRSLFERARAAAPSIIFFDEIDSISGQRTGPGGSASASRSTGAVNMLTTLLTEMDGFEALTGVLVLAATNRPEAIDPALLRPGRFDQVLYVGPPDLSAREAIFSVHLRNVNRASDVDVSELAKLSEGYSGAEIKAICSQAGTAAFERHEAEPETVALEINMADLVGAMERTPRGITMSMTMGYEAWSRQFKKL